MQRPTVDESLCFICQEVPPANKVETKTGIFSLCATCTELVESENRTRNRIKQAIRQNDRLHIFDYTLGMNLLPDKVKTEKL